MTSLLKIADGTIYDPTNNLDGVVQDIWIRDGKIIAPPREPDVRPDRILDAAGLVVMPGGVDMHAHIAGPKVNLARKMRPEDKRNAPVVRRTSRTRSGTLGSVPSTFATGYLYAGMGYTTAFDAAIPPLTARHAHEEFHDTPIIDKGFFLLLGNNHYVLKQIAANEPERLRLRRLAAIRRQGLRHQARQSRRCRSVETGRRQHPRTRRQGRDVRCHAAANHRRAGSNGDGSRSAASGTHSLQQPRSTRQLADDAGHHASAGRTPRSSDAHSISQLRRRGRRSEQVPLASAGVGRLRQRTCEFDGRCRPSSVRRNDLDDGGRAARLLFAQSYWPQMDERRHGDGVRLRHRAHRLQGEKFRPCATMGDWFGVVSARERSLARGSEYRSSQRRFLRRLSRNRAAAHGSRLSPRNPEACAAARASAFDAQRLGPRIFSL